MMLFFNYMPMFTNDGQCSNEYILLLMFSLCLLRRFFVVFLRAVVVLVVW